MISPDETNHGVGYSSVNTKRGTTQTCTVRSDEQSEMSNGGASMGNSQDFLVKFHLSKQLGVMNDTCCRLFKKFLLLFEKQSVSIKELHNKTLIYYASQYKNTLNKQFPHHCDPLGFRGVGQALIIT